MTALGNLQVRRAVVVHNTFFVVQDPRNPRPVSVRFERWGRFDGGWQHADELAALKELAAFATAAGDFVLRGADGL
jgi:hypothetical protein